MNPKYTYSAAQLDTHILIGHLHAVGDMESERCHLSGIIIRDLSCTVSNYRSTKTLDEYLKEQNVLGEHYPSCLLSSCRCRVGMCHLGAS